MPATILSALLAASVTTGELDGRWTVSLLREFARSQTTGFLMDALKWAVLGAALGALVATMTCIWCARKGWYDVNWRFTRGLRWTIVAATLLASIALFSLTGLWSGVLSGSERVLTKSQLATDVFPRIGEAIADGMAWVQVRAESAGDTNTAALTQQIEAFRAGKWELHAPEFLKELDEFRDQAVAELVTKIEQSTLEQAPKLKGGLGEKLLHDFLVGLGRILMESKVNGELRRRGVNQVYSAIRERLVAEAAKAGDTNTVSRAAVRNSRLSWYGKESCPVSCLPYVPARGDNN